MGNAVMFYSFVACSGFYLTGYVFSNCFVIFFMLVITSYFNIYCGDYRDAGGRGVRGDTGGQ